ncbi:MAG: NADH-quinone oxidoreductase subunit J [Anaerolineales bacterium]|jgi:NADH-quinone oxidoreductase subunit J
MNTAFYVSAAVAIVSTVIAITRLNAVHALLNVIVSLLAVAVIFFTLGAPFIAALEVIVYAGAIMVLFIFVVMMLNLGQRAEQQEREWFSTKAWIVPGLLALILTGEFIYILVQSGFSLVGTASISPKQVSLTLFGPYLLAVELASFLLLAGLVGAYHVGRRVQEREQRD